MTLYNILSYQEAADVLLSDPRYTQIICFENGLPIIQDYHSRQGDFDDVFNIYNPNVGKIKWETLGQLLDNKIIAVNEHWTSERIKRWWVPGDKP